MTATPLVLSAALMRNDRTAALLDGLVAPEGITFIGTDSFAPEMFYRQLKFAEFDISEMSVASLTIATSKGKTPWVALPVFSMRRFFHSQISVRIGSPIAKPEDLAGKRVGVPEYQQTAAVLCRGILADEWGVDPKTIHWFMERSQAVSHGGATGFTPPAGIRMEYIPESSGIGQMLAEGTLDATLLYITYPNFVDRSSGDISAIARPLFPSPEAEAHRYFKKTGIYPINHCVVVRRALLEQHPWIARSLFDAFVTVKERLAKRRMSLLHPGLETGVVPAAVRAAVNEDVMAFGLHQTKPALEAVTRYLYEQGLTDRRVALEEVFAPESFAFSSTRAEARDSDRT